MWQQSSDKVIKQKHEKTHQNLDLARTSLVAHSFIR